MLERCSCQPEGEPRSASERLASNTPRFEVCLGRDQEEAGVGQLPL